MLNKIIQGDNLEVMRGMQDKLVDLIITSPPYNLGKDHHTGNKRHNPYNDNMPEKEYQEWQIETLTEMYRVLKDDGSLFYNHKNRIKKGEQISPYEWLLKTPFIVKQEIVWVNRSQNFDKIRLYPWTERVYWLTKSPKTKMTNTLNHCDVFDWNEWKPVGTKGSHTRAFPEEMVSDILKCFPDAKLVMDPYAGSGTTAIASAKAGRDYIGIEINSDYVDIAKGKLNSMQLNLFAQEA